MTEQDIPGGLRLNTLSGWNQTSADWRRFLKQSPHGCFVMEHNADIVGTATTISYENRFAWIGMVLVDPEFRKQGIGTQLLHKTIEHLDHSHIATMKLDATPQGKPLYAKLGFTIEYEIERWILKRTANSALSSSERTTESLRALQLDQICALDKELFGADRSSLLRSLQEQSPDFAMVVSGKDAIDGYCFGRRGLFADHLGPSMSRTPTAAKTLLDRFLTRSSRDTIIVDSFQSNTMALGLLASCGFTLSRPLTRMVRGPNTYPGKPASLCATLGPEFG